MENEPAREVSLVLLHECGGAISGKTLLQKLAYFLAVRNNLDLGFEPHFYGPFSRKLEQEVELLVLSDWALEQTMVLGTSRGGAPINNTRYELTEEGKTHALQAVKENPELAEDARMIVKVLRDADALTTKRVSLAAKIHFILQSQGLPMKTEEMTAKSPELGWRVNPQEVGRWSTFYRASRWAQLPEDGPGPLHRVRDGLRAARGVVS
jgi:uncharacterized protein